MIIIITITMMMIKIMSMLTVPSSWT